MRITAQMKFSDKVKYVRMKLRLSQTELGRQIGVGYSTISRWENNSREPLLMSQGRFYDFCESRGISFEQGDAK